MINAWDDGHIDEELFSIIKALNDAGIKTISSCSGHGQIDGYILCEDMILIYAKENITGEYRKRFHRNFVDRVY